MSCVRAPAGKALSIATLWNCRRVNHNDKDINPGLIAAEISPVRLHSRNTCRTSFGANTDHPQTADLVLVGRPAKGFRNAVCEVINRGRTFLATQVDKPPKEAWTEYEIAPLRRGLMFGFWRQSLSTSHPCAVIRFGRLVFGHQPLNLWQLPPYLPTST